MADGTRDSYTTAPWNPQQVAGLNGYQQSGVMHPFTCPNRGNGDHGYHNGDLGGLEATEDGWVCWFCDYTQDWAHAFMVEDWREMKRQQDELLPPASTG